jgi:hypothetical protein
MTDPIARAVATIAASSGCALIAWAAPGYAMLAVVGIVLSVYFIWDAP